MKVKDSYYTNDILDWKLTHSVRIIPNVQMEHLRLMLVMRVKLLWSGRPMLTSKTCYVVVCDDGTAGKFCHKESFPAMSHSDGATAIAKENDWQEISPTYWRCPACVADRQVREGLSKPVPGSRSEYDFLGSLD